MDIEWQRRVARNESMFRKANEAIGRGRWPGEEGQPVRFRCECARLDCSQVVEMTLADYERVRQDPRRFLVVEGHELPDVEVIVDSRDDHMVVEKVGVAGRVAEATDPRR